MLLDQGYRVREICGVSVCTPLSDDHPERMARLSRPVADNILRCFSCPKMVSYVSAVLSHY